MTINDFHEFILPPNAIGCRLWNGPVDRMGYGRCCVEGRRTAPHRLVWEMSNGDLPKGVPLLHLCMDQYGRDDMSYRLCCTLEHLRRVERHEVVRNNIKLGRLGFPGEQHFNAKLTNMEASAIRTIYASGQASYRNLASQYGVSASTIGEIVRGARYRG